MPMSPSPYYRSQRSPRRSLSKFTVASSSLRIGEVDFDTRKTITKQPPPMQSYPKTGRPRKQKTNILLQKKTIHGSLENLRSKSSPFSFNSPPNSETPGGALLKGNGRQAGSIFFEKKNLNIEPNFNQDFSQDKRKSAEVQTDNIIATVADAEFFSNDLHRDGNQHMSVNNVQPEDSSRDGSSSCNEDGCDSQNFKNISVENDSLNDSVKEQRKKSILYKTLYVIVFKSLRKQTLQLNETEKNLQVRREECAARIILHHLLLNSWKMTKAQASAIASENAQMHKTIDNQSLQLSIIRKMQSIEKEKTATVLKDYNEVKSKYHQAVQENEVIKEEYAKVLGEKRCLESHLEILRDENSRLNTDLRLRLEKKEMLLRGLEMDRLRAEKFAEENEKLLKEAEFRRNEIRDLTTQQAHWQEKAMRCESQCFELKMELQRKLETYENALVENKDVAKENKILALSKSKLEDAVADVQAKLDESTKQRRKLEDAFNECKDELENLEDQVQYLQKTLRRYKKENLEIRQKLYDCTLRNVQKRRVWGSALYFLVNPIEAFRRFYFGSPATTERRGQSLEPPLGNEHSNSQIGMLHRGDPMVLLKDEVEQ